MKLLVREVYKQRVGKASQGIFAGYDFGTTQSLIATLMSGTTIK